MNRPIMLGASALTHAWPRDLAPNAAPPTFVSEQNARIVPLPVNPWADAPLPEDDEIAAAHPVLSGRDDLYIEAMRLVGARHSKSGLVDLVTWLLLCAEKGKK